MLSTAAKKVVNRKAYLSKQQARRDFYKWKSLIDAPITLYMRRTQADTFFITPGAGIIAISEVTDNLAAPIKGKDSNGDPVSIGPIAVSEHTYTSLGYYSSDIACGVVLDATSFASAGMFVRDPLGKYHRVAFLSPAL